MNPENIFYFDCLGSTNNYAKEHADALPGQGIIIADYQNAGKGRLGRSWVAEPGQAVSMSFFYKMPSWDISLLPIVSAVAAAEAVESFIDDPVMIKWPNDLVLNRKKLCGILCESVISRGTQLAVSGIGININQSAENFSAEALPYATSLYLEYGRTYPVAEIRTALAGTFEKTLALWAREGFRAVKTLYTKRLVNLGREVRVIYRSETVQAVACGIADNGNLICRRDDGSEILVNSGEASVRGLYGYV